MKDSKCLRTEKNIKNRIFKIFMHVFFIFSSGSRSEDNDFWTSDLSFLCPEFTVLQENIWPFWLKTCTAIASIVKPLLYSIKIGFALH